MQTPGQLFMFGDGDCGQLGLGEDVTERLRPFPVDVEGAQVCLVGSGMSLTYGVMLHLAQLATPWSKALVVTMWWVSGSTATPGHCMLHG